jgi:hypothetical protein
MRYMIYTHKLAACNGTGNPFNQQAKYGILLPPQVLMLMLFVDHLTSQFPIPIPIGKVLNAFASLSLKKIVLLPN